jgi:hypothetical protein
VINEKNGRLVRTRKAAEGAEADIVVGVLFCAVKRRKLSERKVL